MTRKHFKKIADALSAIRPLDTWPADEADSLRNQWNQDVYAMAAVCRSFNGQFNKDRFLEACGGIYDFSTRGSDLTPTFNQLAA